MSIEGLWKSFGEIKLFQDFSYVFPQNRTCCILGPSGCGKTTLLRLIARLETPDDGIISGVGSAKLSMVFQEDRLFDNLSAERNVLLTARPGFVREDARMLLGELGLDARRTPVRDFSGGMRRRVAIARALAAEYDLLLLDEPFAGLDEASRAQARRTIMNHASAKAIICATHDAEDAAAMEASMLHLSVGKL